MYTDPTGHYSIPCYENGRVVIRDSVDNQIISDNSTKSTSQTSDWSTAPNWVKADSEYTKGKVTSDRRLIDAGSQFLAESGSIDEEWDNPLARKAYYSYIMDSGKAKDFLYANPDQSTIVTRMNNSYYNYFHVDYHMTTKDYLISSGKQLVLGNYTEDATGLGTLAQVGTGILDVDLPGDIRDITHDVTHWKWSWGHAGGTLLDAVGLLPVIGAAKYLKKGGKEVETIAKDGKKIGKLVEGTREIDDLGISKITKDAKGHVVLGELDELGRPTGVTATLTIDMMGPKGPGSKASQSIIPPGFAGGGPGGAGHARGHLLGNQLGGSGQDARNLVTLYQNPVNSPIMRDFETSVRNAVEGGQVVRYQAIPIYEGNELIPKAVTLKARGADGFTLDVTIINKK